MEAHKGTTIDGYPNLFFLVGPNTGLGHNSMIYMIEAAATYILDAIQQMRAGGWKSVDVKPEALRAYNDKLQAKVEGTVWQVGGCKSWYQNDAGRNTALWPDFTFKYRQEVASFDANNYVIEHAAAKAPERAAVTEGSEQGLRAAAPL
jgi:cyclohexanone monooxygenase